MFLDTSIAVILGLVISSSTGVVLWAALRRKANSDLLNDLDAHIKYLRNEVAQLREDLAHSKREIESLSRRLLDCEEGRFGQIAGRKRVGIDDAEDARRLGAILAGERYTLDELILVAYDLKLKDVPTPAQSKSVAAINIVQQCATRDGGLDALRDAMFKMNPDSAKDYYE